MMCPPTTHIKMAVESNVVECNASNVAVNNGYLTLTVPGGQLLGNVTGGEVTTAFSNILYGELKVDAILSQPAGVCNGKVLLTEQPPVAFAKLVLPFLPPFTLRSAFCPMMCAAA